MELIKIKIPDIYGECDVDIAPLNGIHKRQLEFHNQNPNVYKLFDKYAKECLAAGIRKMSSDMILHRIRWYHTIETTGKDFKISNDFSPYYARLWMNYNPGTNLFNLKEVKQ
jgi:hypothetical protein